MAKQRVIYGDPILLACCRVRGHEDKIVTKETEIEKLKKQLDEKAPSS